MRCLVTGAAGFVGSSLVDELLAQGHQVIGVDCFIDYYPREAKERNLATARLNRNFSFIEGNLLELDLVTLFQGVDWIFHQAAQAGVRASWGESFKIYTDNNILATQRLLEAARTVGSGIKRVVYASSSSLYGTAESFPTSETALPAPVSPYGVSKLAAEHLMELYAQEFGVPTKSLRYFTVFGPRQRPDMAFPKFIRAALAGEPLTIYGDGEQTRDFTFIGDIVRANILAAEKTTPSRVFNIAGGTRISVRGVLALLEQILDRKISVTYLPRATGDALHTGGDTTLAQRELGFVPAVSLEAGLRAQVEWIIAADQSARPAGATTR